MPFTPASVSVRDSLTATNTPIDALVSASGNDRQTIGIASGDGSNNAAFVSVQNELASSDNTTRELLQLVLVELRVLTFLFAQQTGLVEDIDSLRSSIQL